MPIENKGRVWLKAGLAYLADIHACVYLAVTGIAPETIIFGLSLAVATTIAALIWYLT